MVSLPIINIEISETFYTPIIGNKSWKAGVYFTCGISQWEPATLQVLGSHGGWWLPYWVMSI